MEKLVDISKRQFDLSFDMLENLILQSPDEIWNLKRGGFVYWQQLLHALAGVNFWMRADNAPFREPFAELKLYPELEQDPENHLSRQQLAEYSGQVKQIAQAFFANRTDAWLLAPAVVYNQRTNQEVILGQVRHLQYHVGHCESILRESHYATPEWLE